MINSIRYLLIAASAMFLPSCQSTEPGMSVEEAKTLTADFKVSEFTNVPRDVDKLREDFENGGPIPSDCHLIRKKREDSMISLAEISSRPLTNDEDSGIAKSLYNRIEESMLSGRFDRALDFIAIGMSSFRHRPTLARFRSQRARILAQTGDVDRAETEMSQFFVGVEGYHADWDKGSTGQIFKNAGLAAVAQAKGDLPLAEHHFRKAVYNASFSTSGNDAINRIDLRTRLAEVLFLQGRLVEAESEARRAIDRADVVRRAKRARRAVYDTELYSGANAGPMAILASVFLEQGRMDDAAYLARIAVNMHEVGCSNPESLGLNRVRATLINVLAQQEKWPQVLEQIGAARDGLSNFPGLFERMFGSSLDYAEAEIYGGDASVGHRIFNTNLSQKDVSDYEVATIKGLQALSFAKNGEQDRALKNFAEAVPDLIRGADDGENGDAKAVGISRKRRIFAGYMQALNSLVDNGITQLAGLNIPGELLRIASATQLGRVEQAFSAAHVRAASGNEELGKLVRQEQDLTEETRNLSQTLAYHRFSPQAASTGLSADTIDKRLQALSAARRALRAEIITRFPEYDELTRPRPMAVGEITSALKSNQALISYHVTDQKLYIWALKNDGQISFASKNVGWNTLFKTIKRLREAVDPGPLSTLGDIPEFDVSLSHDLYKTLLLPVKAGWDGAEEVFIVPHGPLGALPFSMLAKTSNISDNDDKTLFERYRDVDWLVKDVAVTQLPSVNALKGILQKSGLPKGTTPKKPVIETETKNRRPFVGIGDPYFSFRQYTMSTVKSVEVATRGLPFRIAPKTRGVDVAELAMLPRLPGTRSEILSVANALGADLTRDILVGENANEQAVKSLDLSQYDVVSFATHGLVPGDLNGLNQPALALTAPTIGNTEGDGLLSMNEILGLRLNADFAVLSACNTAAADGKGAEAVSGLGRAFFYAGARAILVSNWPVHSAATTDLMSNLFGKLSSDKSLSRSAALRLTKLYQIKDGVYVENGSTLFSYAHPIFWAPFTIVGDGG